MASPKSLAMRFLRHDPCWKVGRAGLESGSSGLARRGQKFSGRTATPEHFKNSATRDHAMSNSELAEVRKYGSVLRGDWLVRCVRIRCQLESGSPLLNGRVLYARATSQRRAVPLSPMPMTERQWELYRLSVVDEWPESPYKAAVIGAIKHKLMILDLQEKASIKVPDTPTSPGKTT
jgi:hypothetical protein